MTTTADIPTLIAALQARQAALGEFADCRSDRERNAFALLSAALAQCIGELSNPPDPRLEERRDYWLERKAAWQAKEAALNEACLAAPDDPLPRRSLDLLRKGILVSGFNETFGSLAGIEQLLAECEEKKERAQQRYDMAVERATKLLAEETTTAAP